LLYMVVESFTKGARVVYERAAKHGRMLPPGLAYINSWVEENLGRCFQLMETEDPALFDVWLKNWGDLGEVEIVPVISSAEASARALA